MAKKTCDWCGKTLPKGRRRFCSNKHKDRYHNWHNPRGKFAHLKDAPDREDTHIMDVESQMASW